MDGKKGLPALCPPSPQPWCANFSLFNSSDHGLMNNQELVWIITMAAEGDNLKGWFRCLTGQISCRAGYLSRGSMVDSPGFAWAAAARTCVVPTVLGCHGEKQLIIGHKVSVTWKACKCRQLLLQGPGGQVVDRHSCVLSVHSAVSLWELVLRFVTLRGNVIWEHCLSVACQPRGCSPAWLVQAWLWFGLALPGRIGLG